MEDGYRRIFTIIGITFILGVTIYANRKKLANLCERRIIRINHRNKDFIKSIGNHI